MNNLQCDDKEDTGIRREQKKKNPSLISTIAEELLGETSPSKYCIVLIDIQQPINPMDRFGYSLDRETSTES